MLRDTRKSKSLYPVSYTHLDVYKRQPPPLPRYAEAARAYAQERAACERILAASILYGFFAAAGAGIGGGTSEVAMPATAFHEPSACLRYVVT